MSSCLTPSYIYLYRTSLCRLDLEWVYPAMKAILKRKFSVEPSLSGLPHPFNLFHLTTNLKRGVERVSFRGWYYDGRRYSLKDEWIATNGYNHVNWLVKQEYSPKHLRWYISSSLQFVELEGLLYQSEYTTYRYPSRTNLLSLIWRYIP